VLGIPPGRDGRTDRRTDRIPIANTRSQQYLPVQLSRVKILKANKICTNIIEGPNKMLGTGVF